MIRVISIIFAFLIFFQSINIHYDIISNMNCVIKHYELHSHRYGDNFIVFLSKHYGDLKEDHKLLDQEERKENEPIHHNITVDVQIDQMITSFELIVKNKFCFKYRKMLFYYEDEILLSDLKEIFEPPRKV